MANEIVTVEQFLKDFSEFEKIDVGAIKNYITRAGVFVTSDENCYTTQERLLMIELMTAHLITISEKNKDGIGNSNGFVSSAHVNNVSVSTNAPPTSDNFEYWLSLTSYGQELLAMFTSLHHFHYYGGSEARVLQ